MTANPSAHVPVLLKLVPNMVLLHPETTEDLQPVIAALQQAKIKTGIVITKSIYPGLLAPLLESSNHALIFSGNLGQIGGVADLLQLEKARVIRKIKPLIEVGWDGGANIKNVRTIAQAAINVINVGRAIMGSPEPAKAYADLVAEADKPGVI